MWYININGDTGFQVEEILYNRTNINSILAYAKMLEGKTFRQLIDKSDEPDTLRERFSNEADKGLLGKIIERCYFGYELNGNQEADFNEVGLELKASPYEVKADTSIVAGERLVLTNLSYKEPIEEDFFKSHAYEKLARILLIEYWRNKKLQSRLDYVIGYAGRVELYAEDIALVKRDYMYLVTVIKSGNAHKISEADTMYLGLCTKGSKSADNYRPQYYGTHELAQKRAFCFKKTYMSALLNKYINPDKIASLITDSKVLEEKSFADILVDRLSVYYGKTEQSLYAEFEVSKNDRDRGSICHLVYAMLGIKNKKVDEFEKAGIDVKTITLHKNKSKNQQYRLLDFKFDTIINEEWETSELYNLLATTKTLFLVFHEVDGVTTFKGCQLWNIPQEDLECVEIGWKNAQQIIKDGVILEKCGNKVKNNIPGIADNRCFHIRPHASQSYFVFEDGTTFGKGSLTDTDILPDGRRMTKQAYWLNLSYMLTQLRPDLLLD